MYLITRRMHAVDIAKNDEKNIDYNKAIYVAPYYYTDTLKLCIHVDYM